MRTERLAIALLTALFLAGATELAAQRRTTERGSSGSSSGGTRQSPGGSAQRGNSGSSSGERRATSGGQRSGSPEARSGGERTTRERPSTETRSTTRERDASGPSPSVIGGTATTRGGKIGAVRDRARAARLRTSRGVRTVSGYWIGACFDCNYWGYYRGYWGWYHGGYWYPAYYPRYHRPDYADDYYQDEAEEVDPREAGRAFGITFLDYPYAGGSLSDATFIQSDAPGRRSYSNLTAQYFGDRGSEVEAGRFALEYGYKLFHGELAYSQYAEPIPGGTDRMHVWRAAAGVQPRLTDRANLVAAVALRGVNLSGGDDAYGPEGELGLQLLPFRPIGINLNGRLAALSWTGDDTFAFRELNATGSLFLGRVELQGGWHWMQLGTAPAFSGPVAGLRIWF